MSKWTIIIILVVIAGGYYFYNLSSEEQDDLVEDTQSIFNTAKDKWESRESNINNETNVIERTFECSEDADCNLYVVGCANCYCEGGKCFEVM